VTLALSDYSLYVYNAIVDLYRVAVLGTATVPHLRRFPLTVLTDGRRYSTAVVNLTTEPTSVNVIKTWTLKPQDMIHFNGKTAMDPLHHITAGLRSTSGPGSAIALLMSIFVPT